MPAERTPPADDTLLSAPLLAITEWTLRAPRTVLAIACGLALISVAITAVGLKFKSSRLDLLNPRSEYNQRWLAYLSEFGNRDDACLVVRAERLPDLTAAIDDLAARLAAEPRLFESVFFRRDLTPLKAKALHYLPADQIRQLQQQLAAAKAVMAVNDPAATFANLNNALGAAIAHAPDRRPQLEAEYGRATGMLLGALTGNLTPPPESHSNQGVMGGELERFQPQYLLADNNTLGFVLTRLNAQPEEPAPNSLAITRLRQIVQEVQADHRHAWIGLTGMPVIEHDEMAASQADMVWTSLLSMVLVLLLYLAAYGGLRHAMLVNVLLLFGTAYSFGFVTIAVGHLNILSAAFSAVLIGLGIDFSIHYVATYLNLRRQGRSEVSALLHMAVEVGPGVVTGGVTNAVAFFMAAMTDFIGVRELGIVAGGGILLCVLSTIIILPPLILLVDRRWPIQNLPVILPAARYFQFPLRHPGRTMMASLLIAALFATGSMRLRYDHNLLNLQPRHLESADIERQLLTRLDDSVWFAVSLCVSPAELQAKKAAFEQLQIVARTEEIASLIPQSSPQDAAAVQALCRQIGELPPRLPAPPPVDISRLRTEVATARDLLTKGVPVETPLTAQLGQAYAALGSLPPDQAGQRITAAVDSLALHTLRSLTPLRDIAQVAPPALADVPAPIRDRYLGKSGVFLLKVYARGDIWNMDQLESFVKAVESVDPKVTGHPVQTYYASRHMQSSYIRAGLYALVAVVVLLYIDLRSLPHALLAMVPPALGFVVMCGCLGWFNIPLNPANMIVLPLILGIGVDHGVHLVHLWRQQRGRFVLSDPTVVAVLLTANTTTASFGALILARHQGLQSLGQTITFGVATCLAASIVFLPALLAWLRRHSDSDQTGLLPDRAGAPSEKPQLGEQEPSPSAIEELPGRAIAASGPDQPPLSEPPAPPAAVFAASQPETDLLLLPATLPSTPGTIAIEPVTEEEVAALLESAFARPRAAAESSPLLPSWVDSAVIDALSQPADQEVDSDPAENDVLPVGDDGALTRPRRRIAPRRVDAA